MKTPNFKDQVIAENVEGFKIVLSFEPEHMDAKDHFINDCGWAEEQYNDIKNFYWFSAKITAFKGVIECGDSYLGGCCYKNLKDVLQDKKLENILGGYAPQMIEEAIEDAKNNLDIE